MDELPVRKVPADYGSPSLRRWRVFEITLQDGGCGRLIVGHDVSNNAVRVSSPIDAFDQDSMTATTRSGRQYILLGTPGWGRRVEQIWRNWCSTNKVVSEDDVTNEYFDAENFFDRSTADDED